MIRKFLLFIVIIVLIGAAFVGLIASRNEPAEPPAIGGDFGATPRFIGQPATATPIDYTVPHHPFMAAQGVNGMHADAYNSDVHQAGPLGIKLQRNTRRGITTEPGGQCATLTFAKNGKLVLMCSGLTGFRIQLMEHRSLNLLAEYKLPIRPSSLDAFIHRDKSYIFEDSSGAYFYLDDQDRVVMATSDQAIGRIAHRKTATGWEFYTDGRWDLSTVVPHDCTTLTNWQPSGECDPITGVLPDHNGLIWWVSRNGRYGTLNPNSGAIQAMAFSGEEIQNGFAVAADGVFILTDHALYGLQANAQGQPQTLWREAYDRGSERKVGSINQGSGTTPTLLGERYVTFTDNADGRINLLVYLRAPQADQNRLICKVPLFDNNHSATDNSMIAFNRSIIIENNAGYSNAYQQQDWSNAGGGISRIDIRPDDSGCDTVWESSERSVSVVPKLATNNGLAYFYSYTQQANGDIAWYLTALNATTGQTQYKALTGLGRDYDNSWSPITLAPDGTAYIGVTKGLIALWDE